MRFDELKLFEKGQFKCVPTDSSELNEVLGGGLRTDNLIVIQGPAGIGKTSFLLRLAYKCVLSGEKVMYISGGEQDARELYERLGCLICGYDYSEFIKEYNDDQVNKACEELNKIGDLIDIEYSDNPYREKMNGAVYLECDMVCKNDMEEFLMLAKKNDYKYVIYDYLGSALSTEIESQYSFLANCAADLKNFATDNHMCIITAMQTNRAFKAALKEKNLDYTTLDETFMADSIGPARKASICITICRNMADTHIVVWKNRLNGVLKDIKVFVNKLTFDWESVQGINSPEYMAEVKKCKMELFSRLKVKEDI